MDVSEATIEEVPGELAMAKKLIFRLLGGLDLSAPKPIGLPTRKSALMAVYLAMQADRAVPRERVRNLLWSDRRDEQAAGSLRRALADLRKVLGDHELASILDSAGGSLSFSAEMIEIDIAHFERCVRSDGEDAMISAANTYGGDLLEGISIPDPAYDAWLLMERRRLRLEAVKLVEKLSLTTRSEAGLDSVSGLADRLLRCEQTCEEAHRALIRYHMASGRSTAAARQYEACRSALDEALGIAPEQATLDLWAQVGANDRAASPQPLLREAENRNDPCESVLIGKPPAFLQPGNGEKPSVAVLPFKNLSGDPEQNYFVDGIVEDITNGLSKFRSLLVIARHSSFEFGGKSASIAEIVADLGARYLVEGSVRRFGKGFRITVQLIDGFSNTQTWSQRYDRDIEEIFAVQDEVTDAIVAAIEPELLTAERERIRQKPPKNLNAWELTQHGLWHLWQQREGSHMKAFEILERAIALDAHFASSHAGRAYAICHAVKEGVMTNREAALDDALSSARMAVRLDPNDAFSYVSLGRTHLARQEYNSAIEAYEVAIDLNPNLAYGHFGRGYSLCLDGRVADALPSLDQALMLSPRDPQAWSMATLKSFALTILQRYDEALEWARKAQLLPNAPHWAFVAEVAPLAYLGKNDEAEKVLAAAVKLKPELDVAFAKRAFPFKGEEGMELLAQAMLTTFVPRQQPGHDCEKT